MWSHLQEIILIRSRRFTRTHLEGSNKKVIENVVFFVVVVNWAGNNWKVQHKQQQWIKMFVIPKTFKALQSIIICIQNDFYCYFYNFLQQNKQNFHIFPACCLFLWATKLLYNFIRFQNICNTKKRFHLSLIHKFPFFST